MTVLKMKNFVGIKLSLITLFMAAYAIESNAVVPDCASSISGTITISSACNLGSSGLTINSGATLNAGFGALIDTTTSGYIINNGAMNFTDVYALVIDSSIVSEITNSGSANFSAPYGIRLDAGGTITNFTNTSTGTYSMGADYAIRNNGGTITNFTNAGSINFTSGYYGLWFDTGTIGTFTNTGTMTGTTFWDIRFSGGTFTTLNNQQGRATSDPLTMTDPPTNYNIIIASASDYGQIKFLNTGSLNFGIYGASVIDSTTYTSVLSGITATDLASNIGTFGSLDWQLVETSSGSKIWDLLFATPAVTVPAVSVLGSTSNKRKTLASGAAAVIDTNQVLLDEFVDLTGDQQIANAAESTLPAIAGGVSQITTMTTNAVTDVVSARQDIKRGLSSGDEMMTDRHIWFKPFGGWTEQDTRQGVTGYDIDSYGLALGFDGDVSSSWNVGFAFAYINSDVESNLAAGSHTIDMDSYQTKVYATNMLDNVTALNLQAGIGLSNYDSNRRLFNSDAANADYDSWNTQLSAELERSYQVSGKTVMTPYVHADYSYVSVESYNESGAGVLSLNVNDDSADSLIIGTGVKANHTLSDSLLLMANAGIGYDVMTDRNSLTSSFAGGGAQFTTEGIEPDEWVYNAGVGAKYSLANGTEITAAYTVDARQDYTDQSVSANFRMMF
jgi:outer membrane autotransporter protein